MPTFHSVMAPNEAHLSAIGRVALLWTQIEFNLGFLIWELAPLEQPKAQAVTTHLSNQLLIDIAKSLVNESLRGTELCEKLINHLEYISNDIRPKRNNIIHGIWGPTGSKDKISIIKTTARGKVKFQVGDEMTANDLLVIAAEIDEALFKLIQLTHEASSQLFRVKTIHV